MKHGNFELEVCLGADDPKPLRQYGHDGHTFVEGKPGTPFCLVFRNHSSDRVEVVPAVDGLSVMDGKTATEDSEGYVVEPYRRVVIKGWRTSLKDSSKFVFEKSNGSYTVAIGNGVGKCGVIGVLVYKEKERAVDTSMLRKIKDMQRQIDEAKRNQPTPVYVPYPVYPAPHYPKPYWGDYPITWCSTSSGMPNGMGQGGNVIHTAGLAQVVKIMDMEGGGGTGASAQNCSAVNAVLTCSVHPEAVVYDESDVNRPDHPIHQTLYVNNLGTAWGDKQADEVREISFKRGELVGEMEIQYNDRAGLEALGIRFEVVPAVPKYPSAFTKRVFCEVPNTHMTKK